MSLPCCVCFKGTFEEMTANLTTMLSNICLAVAAASPYITHKTTLSVLASVDQSVYQAAKLYLETPGRLWDQDASMLATRLEAVVE